MKSAYEAAFVQSPPAAWTGDHSGYPTSGNPAQGVPPTTPGAYWFHMVSSEIEAAIRDSGLVPAHENIAQLSAGIAARIAAHDESGAAHADIRGMIGAVSGGMDYRGSVLTEWTPEAVGVLTELEITATGSGYAVGQALYVSLPGGLTEIPAMLAVSAVDGSGGVTALEIVHPGAFSDISDPSGASVLFGQTAGSGFAATASFATGNGETLADIESPKQGDIALVLRSTSLGGKALWIYADRNGDGIFNWIPFYSTDLRDFILEPIGAGEIDETLFSVGRRFQFFTENEIFTVPAGVTELYVTAAGGGGGGGGGNTTGRGAGGGGGACVYRRKFTVSPGQSIAIAIGAGGPAGSPGQPGGVGGSTVIGSLLTLPGGFGGTFNGKGGSGGPGGDYLLDALGNTANSGASAISGGWGGGTCVLGLPNVGAGTDGASTYGGQGKFGSGGCGNPNSAPYYGGPGGAGFVLLEW